MFAPAIDMNRVGVADEQQTLALPCPLALRPDVRAARQEFAGLQSRQSQGRHFLLKIGDEVCLIAGDAFVLHGAAEKRQSFIAVEHSAQAPGEAPR